MYPVKLLRNVTMLINFPVILRVVGWLLMIEAAFMLVPMTVALCFGETDWQAFGISAIVAFLFGYILTSQIHLSSHRIGKREGFILTAMVWVAFSIFGMLPFLFCSTPLNVSDAFFEAMSGFTTTGVTVTVADMEFSNGIQMWRALMQWIGGMGIILFTLAVIPMLNHSGGVQMFNSEVTGITHDKLRPRISQTALSLWMVYFILTGITFILLWLGPMNWFDAICHAFGTLSTGGFTTSPEGITDWHSDYVLVVVTIFMILGGTNFILIYRTATGNFSAMRKNEVFKVFVAIILIITVLFISSIAINGKATTWRDVTILPLFQVVSAITSTGYIIPQFQTWGFFVMALIFLMMLTGGCAGSTSGGVKIDRFIVLSKFCHNEIYRCIYPNSIKSVKINGKVMPREVVTKVIAFLCLFVIVLVVGAVALTTLGMDVAHGFVASLSCTSCVGIGIGEAAQGTWSSIPQAARWVMSALMLIGRLEVFTILVLFSPAFWKR